MNFSETLKVGQAGESAIARWLRGRGCSVMPVYEKIIDTGKGPTLFMPRGKVIAPDLFVFRGPDAWWIEAKSKTAFSEHRISNHWVTGIDLHHYEQYLIVNESTPWPVWLLFLQMGGQAKDAHWGNSPAGLFGGTLDRLKENENHRHANWGKTGMVYWSYESLALLATIEEVVSLEGSTQ